jgi:cysteine synthase
VLVPRGEGIRAAISRAAELAKERGAFAPRQFENPMRTARALIKRGFPRGALVGPQLRVGR